MVDARVAFSVLEADILLDSPDYIDNIYIKYIIKVGAVAIKFAILGLLHYKDMHGYQIKKHIERNFGFMWSVNYGQIYPNLKSLAEDKLVEMCEVSHAGERGPQRKCYSLTEAGREAFARWLAGDPERSMILRDPFLMRFVFFGFGDRERALRIIDGQIGVWARLLETREENMRRWRGHDIHVRLIVELGVEQNRVFLDWLKRAREEIARSDDETLAAAMSPAEGRDNGQDGFYQGYGADGK